MRAKLYTAHIVFINRVPGLHGRVCARRLAQAAGPRTPDREDEEEDATMRRRMDRARASSEMDGSLRPAPYTRLWLAAAMVLLVPAAPAVAYDWEIYIQCSDTGGNLNDGDLSAASVGSYLADATHPDWGGAEGYGEAAQVQMDQDGGNPGLREHAGVKVVKLRSKSSPLYMEALVTKALLQCTIEFWDQLATPAAKEYTIALVNARVASIEYHGVGSSAQETIVFHAQQITWTHYQTSTTYTDSLTAPP